MNLAIRARMLDSVRPRTLFARHNARPNTVRCYSVGGSSRAAALPHSTRQSRTSANAASTSRIPDAALHRGFTSSAVSYHGGLKRPAPGTGIKVHFKDSKGNLLKTIEGNEGDDLLSLAHEHDIDLEGACEGSVACSTCHVILDPEHYDLLPEAEDDENDMLDMAFGLTDTSRLGCQVQLTKELDGMTATLPSATRNMFVDGESSFTAIIRLLDSSCDQLFTITLLYLSESQIICRDRARNASARESRQALTTALRLFLIDLMPYSHHSHSGQFCKHASGTLEDVVKEAVRQGFEVFGLSEHVPRYRAADLYPEEEGLTPQDLAAQFDAFLDEAHRLKTAYADRIVLLVGAETEHISPADLDGLDALIARAGDRVEYLVGSVHHVNGIPIDFDEATFRCALESFSGSDANTEDEGQSTLADPKSRQMEAFLCAYFDAQHELMQRFHPEVIGHVDLCRLYNPSLRLEAYPRAWAKLKRNVRYGAGYGALFECNAAALRKGWDGSYPGEDVVKVIQECGGRFALSDDSHGPHAVGLNYARMRAYLRRVGVDELWVLEAADTPNAGGRKTRSRRIEGRWWEHAFWARDEDKDGAKGGQS
ncbi:hypothetical protein EIP86_003245 [Pleurotus ostreatoroseus]|nr:hypothetical protein EIP86_003245 [Pleurotus ostreatoroseus]